MRVSIYLVAIVTFLTVFYMPENIVKDYLTVLFNLLFVILGFSLGLVWDQVKSERADRKEADSIVRLLRLETARIHGAITNNIKMLENHTKNKELLNFPLSGISRLESNTWNSTKSRSHLFVNNTADLIQIEKLYTMVSIANEEISFRENFMNTNFNKKFYQETLKIIDLQLLHRIKLASNLNEIVQKYLYQIPPIYTEGPDFDVSKGVVTKIKKK